MEEKVSIIVPMYKVEEYVAKCIESLLKQTYKNIIIYAISDGSPDHSLSIAKGYADKDKRVICIDKENGGYGSVLEYAISVIDSEYFLICDPDDWLKKNAIEVLVQEAKAKNAEIVIGDKYNVLTESSEKTCVKTNSEYPFVVIKPNIVEERNAEKYSFLYVSPHAKLYKTSVAKNIIFPHHVSYTDFVLYSCSLMKAKRVLYIDRPLAYYLIDRPGNTNTDRSVKAVRDHIVVWFSIYEQLMGIGGSHCYLLNRLYFEYKMILSAYFKYVPAESRKELQEGINKIRNILISRKKEITGINNNSIKRMIDYKLLLNKRVGIETYEKIKYILGKK